MNRALLPALLSVLLISASLGVIIIKSSMESLAVGAPSVAWGQMLMHGDGYSVFQLADGSFILSAANESATFLIKTDSNGNLTSMKTIQIDHESTLLPYLVPTADGGYAFAGIWRNQYALAKTDFQGSLQWTKLYSSGAPINYFRSIIQTSDGGFAIAGFGENVEEGEGWIWFAKTDASGNMAWNETLSGPIADCPSTIIQTPDGGYTMSDVSYSIVPNQAFFRLIKIDPNGNVLWNRTYGGEGKYSIPESNCAIITEDGGYLISGFLSGRNAWVVKTDADGNMQWNHTYGSQYSAITCTHITQDGGYILAAVLNRTDAWLIKTGAVGNEIWNMTFPEATLPVGLEANFNSVIQTKDGSYVMLGSKNQSVWLVKLAYQADSLTTPQLLSVVAVALAVAAIVVSAVTLRAAFSKKRNRVKTHLAPKIIAIPKV